MQNSKNNDQFEVKLQVAFPKSSEDHRLQLVIINGSVFAILHSPLESNGPINLYCEPWSLILLAPIKSKADVQISAINIICLSEINSEEGTVNIHASNRLVKLAPSSTPSEKMHETAKGGEFHLCDNQADSLICSQIFNNVISCAHAEDPDSFLEAQQKFIGGLCFLAEKMEGKTAPLNINSVLGIWDIPNS